ncbi:MAG TPA: diaminopimelate decarboxylase, partial [Caulobacteraceae bacterium]|nr:diaminopimelate decarboxylase [Caulobacteraceae bacterium]
MNHFEARDGALACERVPLARIAEAVGTPAYVYSTATLVRHVQVFREAVSAIGPPAPIVAYAVKANSNLSVLKTLFRLGVWADTVSEGEIRRALAAGLEPGRIVFSGVGKTDAELAFAVDSGVAEINVEAEPELNRLSAVAGAKGARQAIAIRVNPDVAAGGHAKIATGQA